MPAQKMKCPACGAEMNLHAYKVDAATASKAGTLENEFGGTVEEFHKCAKCGASATRKAQQ